MVWPVAVTQARQGIAHRHSKSSLRNSGKDVPDRDGPGRQSAMRNYFLRSLRFQHDSWLSAFSLVIGISVVYSEPLTEPGFTPDDSSHLIVPAICAACVGTS